MADLTPIGEVLKNQFSTRQPDSNEQPRTENKKERITITPSEAKARGIPWGNDPPPNTVCQFCGATLEPEGILFNNSVFVWQPHPMRCTCKKAQEHWAEHDRRETEKKAREEEAERQHRMNLRIEKLLGQSGIKKRFQQRTFKNFRRDTKGRDVNYRVAKAYADNWPIHFANGNGLYIEGTNGTGKTHLAAAIALQLIGQGVPVICKTSSDLLMDIKRTFDRDGTSEAQVLDVYKRVDLLIVDDIGKEQCSDWSMSTLYSIFNDRYEDMKPTIITTNYGADDLVRALTPKGYDDSKIVAIISRLRETSTVMTMVWDDIRGCCK